MDAKCGTELKPGQLVAFMSYADLKIGKVDKLTPQMVKVIERTPIWDHTLRKYVPGHTWSSHAKSVKPEHVAVIHADSPEYTPAHTPPPGAGERLT